MPDFYRTKSISIDFTIQAVVHLYAVCELWNRTHRYLPLSIGITLWKYNEAENYAS